MKINKELIKGSTSILVLSLLRKGEMYGYEIIKEMQIKSNSVFEFKEGTLYPILHGLEEENLVESFWKEGENARKRKYYKITKKGIGKLKEKQEEWNLFTSTVNKIITE
ncbi:helix-turn-helix transcriptional regulator [Clostridium sp. C2-6-12]|uniref:PadR family transcriptional regulator n=1 Tax=Clostridium sp. C2-6-12 TaxID=2698832 RepID=UPI00136DDCBA|nr:helix-turn-helix transcriptional regulator [Clostridium sp. C2-6-12]